MTDSTTHANAAACPKSPDPNQRNELLGTDVLYSIDVIDSEGYAHHMVLNLDVTISLIEELFSHPALSYYISTGDDPDSP